MPQSQAAPDPEKLREFEVRMHYEGVDAFAAGPSPWEHWEDAGTLGTWRRLDDSPHYRPHRHTPPERTTGQRLLGAVTRLLVLMLLVGIGGVYFSSTTQPTKVISGIRPPPIRSALPRTRPDTRGANALANKLDTLPAPAAGLLNGPVVDVVPESVTPLTPVPATTTARQEMTGTTPLEPATLPAPAGSLAERSAPQPSAVPPAPGAVTPPEPAPLQITQAETLDAAPAPLTPPSPVPPAAEPVPAPVSSPATITAPVVALLDDPGTTESPAQTLPPLSASNPGDGDWVVNLAAYRTEADARHALARFRNKGVEAELVHVTVHDRPLVRIRATGYHTAREARDWVGLLEERLGLEGVWISKR
jgi:cell division septation protein DedD